MVESKEQCLGGRGSPSAFSLSFKRLVSMDFILYFNSRVVMSQEPEGSKGAQFPERLSLLCWESLQTSEPG